MHTNRKSEGRKALEDSDPYEILKVKPVPVHKNMGKSLCLS